MHECAWEYFSCLFKPSQLTAFMLQLGATKPCFSLHVWTCSSQLPGLCAVKLHFQLKVKINESVWQRFLLSPGLELRFVSAPRKLLDGQWPFLSRLLSSHQYSSTFTTSLSTDLVFESVCMSVSVSQTSGVCVYTHLCVNPKRSATSSSLCLLRHPGGIKYSSVKTIQITGSNSCIRYTLFT